MQMSQDQLKLLKKCEDEEIASQGMGACQVLLEQMDQENMKFDEENPEALKFENEDPNDSYIQMAQKITPNDVPKVLNMAFKMKEDPNVSPGLKNAANRLIRAIEAL